MHNLLILNPVSGKKESREERIGQIICRLTQNGNEVTVCQTRGRGDAREFAATAPEGVYDRIVCCGGDGTLHEVVNGLMRRQEKLPLGYIPMGSTNDYAKNLGITKKNALQCLEENRADFIDIGCMNGEYFNYVAAFGAFTSVSFNTPQQMKNTFGYFAYLLEGIKQLADVAPKHIRFCVDGTEQEDDIIIGMVTNAFSVAGMKNLNQKQVQLDDGRMEYLFIKYPKNFMELQTIIGQLLNEKVDERYIHYGQFRKLTMESEPMEWTVDGENGGLHEFVEIKAVEKNVRIVSMQKGKTTEKEAAISTANS
ncbi:MAG: diacylglycerol kinase family lipid kinase [Lachnospiraceae bacterium]|nr:diacylglycerol kinase family lipid kinase [Lachnospiraceae bacterium]MBP3610843.1 diacylglycerol kinase family lipid kinase [Lachnospiraceae bacterium]